MSMCVCVCVPARDEIDGATVVAKRKTRNDSVLSQYINQTLTMFLISFQQTGDRAQHTHTRSRSESLGVFDGEIFVHSVVCHFFFFFFTSRNHFIIIIILFCFVFFFWSRR